MVIHSQNIVLVLQSHTITHSAANCEKMMVISCSWMGEYTSVKLLHRKGGSSGILSKRSVSPFSFQMGENVNEIDSGCQTKSLDKTSKSSQWASSTASGHQKNFQWASTTLPVGSQQQRSSEQFSTQQKQQWVVSDIISQWDLKFFLMLISCKR